MADSILDKRKVKICFLGYGELYNLAKEVTDSLKTDEVDYLIYDCNMDTQDGCIQDALSAGCEVFIAGPGNAAYFRSRHNLPLIEIPIRTVEYAIALRKALLDGHKDIAIVHYSYTQPIEIEMLSNLMSCSITEIKFENVSEMFSLVRDSECDAFIGAAGTLRAAEAAGKAGYLVYSNTSSIKNVCFQAEEAARNIMLNRRNRAITNAVMQNSALAIIVTDTEGRIDFFNRVAQSYTGLSSRQIRGHKIDEYLPNLSVSALLKDGGVKNESFRLVGGIMMRCVQERIQVRSETIGVLTTLYPEAHNRKRTSESRQVPGIYASAFHWKDLIAESKSMKRLIAKGTLRANSTYPLVIYGEEGSGREGIATCVHFGSDRADAPCVTLDLATIAEQDAPRILFGYDRDDGAVEGMFSNASGGSIILKNLSLAKPSAIACLRQMLNGNSIYRPGMRQPISTDIRFITIAAEGEMELLPSDLSSVLSIERLRMPPLRERKEDILPLLQRYLRQFSDLKRNFTVTDEMAELLWSYGWRGNIHELRSTCARYVNILRETEQRSSLIRYRALVHAIGEDKLVADLAEKYPVLLQRPITDREAFAEAFALLKQRLRCSNDDAAEKLGISRTTLWRLTKSEK